MTKGPLTLPQAEALDFEALWRSMSDDDRTRIGALVLRNEMFLQLQEDGGFHTTFMDRENAERQVNATSDRLRASIWAALPDVMPTVYDEPYPLFMMLENEEPPVTVDVRDLGERRLVHEGWRWFVPNGSALVELGGAVDLDCAKDGAPRRWQFWTVDQIAEERLRRHPEMAQSYIAYGEIDHARAA